jgi:hypothetical protein
MIADPTPFVNTMIADPAPLSARVSTYDRRFNTIYPAPPMIADPAPFVSVSSTPMIADPAPG